MTEQIQITVVDAVKVLEKEWDRTPEEERVPYRESIRKGGYVYAIRISEKAQ